MAFGVKRDNSGQANQHVLLEVTLPDDETVYKYSVKRLRQRQVVAAQVKATRAGQKLVDANSDLSISIFKDIDSIDGSIDFSDLIDKVANIGGDDSVEELTVYIIKLATEDINKLKNEGISVW